MVRAYLRERGVPFDVFIHPRVLTGIAEARAIGVDAGEVLKTLVVDTVRGQALLVLPASRRIDMHRVREAVADPHARLATEAEILRDYPASSPGPFRRWARSSASRCSSTRPCSNTRRSSSPPGSRRSR